MPNRDDEMVGTADRRKVFLLDVARRCGGLILSDGEVWDGAERREEGKRAIEKPVGNKPASKEKTPCDFFG